MECLLHSLHSPPTLSSSLSLFSPVRATSFSSSCWGKGLIDYYISSYLCRFKNSCEFSARMLVCCFQIRFRQLCSHVDQSRITVLFQAVQLLRDSCFIHLIPQQSVVQKRRLVFTAIEKGPDREQKFNIAH